MIRNCSIIPPGDNMSSPPLHSDSPSSARRRRNVVVLAIAFGVLLWVGVLFYLFSSAPDDSEADQQEEGRGEPPPTMEILYNYDATDPEQLFSRSDAVFVGRVGRRSGDEPLTSTIPGETKPQSQYQVTVLDSISGSVEAGQGLTVNQIGGRSPEDGRDYVVAGVVGQRSYIDSMLEGGDEYLFVVTRNPRTGFHDLIAQPQGKVPLSNATPNDRREIIGTFESVAQSVADDGSPSTTNSSEGR